MAEFKNFVAKAKDIADGIGKKAGELSELAKLKTQIIDVESETERLYKQLGKAYYAVSMGQQADTDPEQLLSEIKGKIEQAAALRAQYNSNRGIKICKICGHQLNNNDEFCSKCGQRIRE